MIVPSIDIRRGRAVQLVGGRGEPKIDGGDPLAVAERFARVGEIAVIDLDAALGTGDNREVVDELCRRHRCRVGGGIRTVEAALERLDAGAVQVILGTAATPDLLSRLPRERTVAALDAVDGEVVDRGWTRATGARVEDRMDALRDHVSGFLLTFVEREGRMEGSDLERARDLVARAGDAKVTIAGGVTTADEVAALDRSGADAQVGMALYTGTLSLADAFAAPLTSDRPDGLWPTVVCDPSERALGLAYSDRESLARAIDTGRGVYRSRSRGLWEKGASSGNVQHLVRVEADCDRDALRFVVEQAGDGFCHRDTRTCFGDARGLAALERTLLARAKDAPAGSYTRRLLDDPALLAEKLSEEARELAEAGSPDDVAWEAADVLYFAFVAMARAGVGLADVERHLDRRALAVRRRSARSGETPR